MKIGILGCGYVGQAVALFLKEHGHAVSATTRSAERFKKLQTIVQDLHLISQSKDLVPFLSPLDVLLVCAAPGSSDGYRSTYLELAENVVQALPQAKQLHQIIYTGSTSVYGECGGAWVNEESLPDPLTLKESGRILLETEKCYLSASKAGLNVCIYRLGEIYGPGRWIEDRLKRSYQNKFSGDGSPYTNLIHLKDIVSAVNLAINQNLQGIYNLCNDFHIPRRDFYDLLCKQHNIPTIQWDDQLATPHGGNKRVDNQKMKGTGFAFSPF